MVRRPHDDAVVDELAPRPGLRVDVHVLVLQRRRQDQLLPTGEDARRLGAANVLAAAEGDQVGAHAHDRPEVGGRRQRDRGVDDDRQVVAVGDVDQVLERQARDGVVSEVEHGARLLADRLADLVGKRPFVGEADFDDLRPGQAERVVVVVAVPPQHHDLVGHAGRVGQAVHLRRVQAGDRGRGSHGQSGRGAGRDVAGLGAGDPGDDRSGRVLEIFDPDEVGGRFGHRGHDLGVEHAAAGLGALAARVDDAAAPKLQRDRHLVPLLQTGRREEASSDWGPVPALGAYTRPVAGDAVLILADDLIWASRLADLVGRLGRRVVRARDLGAFERALPESAEVVVDLTARAYDGVAAVDVAARAGHRVLCVGQHDDEALRERARAAGAERVLAYRAVFEGGPEGIGRWLSGTRLRLARLTPKRPRRGSRRSR